MTETKRNYPVFTFTNDYVEEQFKSHAQVVILFTKHYITIILIFRSCLGLRQYSSEFLDFLTSSVLVSYRLVSYK